MIAQKETPASEGRRDIAASKSFRVTLFGSRSHAVVLRDADQALLDVAPFPIAEGLANAIQLRHLRRLERESVRLQRILRTVQQTLPEFRVLDRPAHDRADHLIAHMSSADPKEQGVRRRITCASES